MQPCLKQLLKPKTNIKNPNERYRVIQVKDPPYVIQGNFEPVTGMQRNRVHLYVLKNGKVEEGFTTEDNTMKQHIQRSLNFLFGTGSNPCPVNVAINTVKSLHNAVNVALEN